MKDTKGSVKSPSRTDKELRANLGGLPPTKDVKEIDKVNMPPKTPPSSGGSKSVRV